MNLAYSDMKKILLEKRSESGIEDAESSEVECFVLEFKDSFKRALNFKKIIEYLDGIENDLDLSEEESIALDLIKMKIKGTNRQSITHELTQSSERYDFQKIINALVSIEQILFRNFPEYKISFDHSQFKLILSPKALI